jgi:6-phospho-beta-glucosidase
MIDRIAVLGGSSVYAPELILSIISHNLNVKEIVLIGREGRKLPLVAQFCQRLLNKSGFPASIVSTTDLAEGVAGARYIINNIRVGGMEARLRDEKLPPKFSMIGDQGLGAGGFANAMRTLPVVLHIAEIVEQVSPDAVFINLTNPIGIIVEALIKHSKLNVIGVSDTPGVYIKKLARLLNREPAEICVNYLGLNHMGWIQDIIIDKRSCMALALERIDAAEEDGFDRDLISLFRVIPTKTVSLYFHADEVLKKQQSCARYRAEVLYEAELQILKLYENENLSELPELTRERNAIWYEDTILPLIEALESKHEEKRILCVKNEGAIRDLPEDCSVEIQADVSKKGIKPHKVGNCPHFLRGLFIGCKESDRLTIEAVRHRSYEYALQALTIHPLVPSLDTAKKFLDRIIKDEHLELH